MNNVTYINIQYLLRSLSNTERLSELNYQQIKDALDKNQLIDAQMVIFDMTCVDFSIAIIDDSTPKKSVVYYTFEHLINSHSSIDFIFANTTEEMTSYIKEKDFNNVQNVYLITFIPTKIFINCKNDIKENEIRAKWSFLIKEKNRNDYFDSILDLHYLFDKLIADRIRYLLINNLCITPIEKEDHILTSTSVHVNKYVDIKPIIENYECFDEICFYLSRQISSKFTSVPDFLIAPSKNAISIASGLLKFFRKSDMIIFNQLSPITAFNNYSNINAIKTNARYAIIEDFYCMGSEIKIVKGILWSHGINVDEDVAAFPIASTQIYGNDYRTTKGFTEQKIYPLYKLDEDLGYIMFTQNCCPVCNDIICQHRKLFNF